MQSAPPRPPVAGLPWIDRWISKAARVDDEGDELLRARLTVVIGFAGTAAMAIALVLTEQAPAPWLYGLGVLMMGVFAAGPLLQPHLRDPRPIRHGILAAQSLLAIVLCVATIGRDLGALLLAVQLPIFAVAMAGPRVALFWSSALIATWIASAYADYVGVTPMLPVDLETEVAWSLAAGSVVVGVSMCVAMAIDQLRRSTLARLRDARDRADRAHGERLRVEARFRESLEAEVEERTRALLDSQEQLRRADRLAAIGTLAAGVAHQINNPIGSILISAQYALADDADDTNAADAAKTIERHRDALRTNAESAERCGRIVKNLLALSRTANPSRARVDLNAAVREALGALPVPPTPFAVSLADPGTPVDGDSVELEQLVTNLVRNASESGHPDSLPIHVRTTVDGDSVVLRVADRGRGIPAEDRDHVFDPFFTTRVKEGGTGLGLSLVHAIVENHGGSIRVASEPDKGAEFVVTFPLARD